MLLKHEENDKEITFLKIGTEECDSCTETHKTLM